MAVAALVGAILLPGGAAPSSPPPLSTHLDVPGPGVALGTVPTTAKLRAAVAIHRFPAKHRKPGTAGSVGAAAVGDLIPGGLPGLSGLTQHLSPSCSGTGTDGNRVQVIYAVEAGRPDRYATLAAQLQSWIADVDDTVGTSAAKTGGARRVRWVHSGCVPVIAHEVLAAGSLTGGFSSTITALKNRGYTSAARKYLVFADDATLCGIGQIYADSDKSNNANDGDYPMFARVDSPCWAFSAGWHSTAAHELFHTLGAVQDDAPNTTKAGHCRDETDLMCYADGGLLGTMLSVCLNVEGLLDCRNDDYFNTAPPAGSYLALHWNPADSSFLDGIAAPPPPPPAAPSVSVAGATALRAGLSGTYTATSPDSDVAYTWSATPAGCLPGGTSSASVVLACPSTATGSVVLTVSGARPGGAATRVSRSITLTASPKVAMTVTLTAAPTRVAPGATAALTARTSYGGVGVRTSLTLFEQNPDGTYAALSPALDAGVNGVRTWRVTPRRSTTYSVRVATSATGGWTATAPVAVAVRVG